MTRVSDLQYYTLKNVSNHRVESYSDNLLLQRNNKCNKIA